MVKTFGQVDILINNAGMSRAMPSEQITDELWQEDLDLKLFAAIRLARLCWPGMKARKWGRIINVLNTGAKAPRANGAPTAVSRAAGMALMKVLAGEGAPHGILVNGMLVGLIDSDQHRRRHAREGANVSYDEFTAKMGAGVPLGRIGKAEEFAAMACFLCSDHAGVHDGDGDQHGRWGEPGGLRSGRTRGGWNLFVSSVRTVVTLLSGRLRSRGLQGLRTMQAAQASRSTADPTFPTEGVCPGEPADRLSGCRADRSVATRTACRCYPAAI